MGGDWMRTIKFRAWDKREKEMILPGELPNLRKKDIEPGNTVNLCDLNTFTFNALFYHPVPVYEHVPEIQVSHNCFVLFTTVI